MVQWQRGEWWNALPDGRKEEICEKSKANVSSSQQCGSLVKNAEKYNLGPSQAQTFKYLKLLVNQHLTTAQRSTLLEKSRKTSGHQRD